jgi:hypothetical protein
MDERVLTVAGPCRGSLDESSGRHPAQRPRIDEGPPPEPSERVEEVLLLPHRRTIAALLARLRRPQGRIARLVALLRRLLDWRSR